MVFEFLISHLLDLVNRFMVLFPTFEAPEFIYDYLDDFSEYINVVLYVLPVSQLLPLIRVIIGFAVCRIIIAAFKFVKGCIPLMST